MARRPYFVSCHRCGEVFLTKQRPDDTGKTIRHGECWAYIRIPYDPEEAAEDWIALVEGRLAVEDLAEKYGKYGITREHLVKLLEKKKKKPRVVKEKAEAREPEERELKALREELSSVKRDVEELKAMKDDMAFLKRGLKKVEETLGKLVISQAGAPKEAPEKPEEPATLVDYTKAEVAKEYEALGKEPAVPEKPSKPVAPTVAPKLGFPIIDKPPEKDRPTKPKPEPWFEKGRPWTDEDWFPAGKRYGIYPRLIVFAGWWREPVVAIDPFIPFLNFCVYRVKKGIIIDRKPDFKLWDWSTREFFRRQTNVREVNLEYASACKSIKLTGVAYLDASRLTNEEVDAILNKIDWPDWQNVLLLGFDPKDVIGLLKEKRLVTAVFYEETDDVRGLQKHADLYVFSSGRPREKPDKRHRKDLRGYEALRRAVGGLLRRAPTLNVRCFFFQRPDVPFVDPWRSYEDYVMKKYDACSLEIMDHYGEKHYKEVKPILPRLPPAIYVPHHVGEIEYHA